MRFRRFAVALLWAGAPLLAGCFQSSTLVKLNPDGTGTIEQTTAVKAELYADFQAPNADDPFSVDAVRAHAREMGSGVTFVSSTRIDTPTRKGIKAVYAFKDIGTVSLSAIDPPGDFGFGSDSDDPITFTFTRLPNGHSLLTIENGVDQLRDAGTSETARAAEPPSGVDDNETDMMKAMLAGLKIDFAIQVGHVVKTNIPYVSGGTVTLFSVDFDKLFADPAAIEKAGKASSAADTLAAFREVKGTKISLEPEVTIEFRK